MHVNKGSGDRRERRHLETRMAGQKDEQQGRERPSKDLQHAGIPPSAANLGKVNSPDHSCTD